MALLFIMNAKLAIKSIHSRELVWKTPISSGLPRAIGIFPHYFEPVSQSAS